MERTRHPDEIPEAFSVQIKALRKSCESYDGGDDWEAARLAATVYILVHDGGKKNRDNKSILTQLGLRKSIKFLASGHDISAKGVASSPPLVSLMAQPDGAWYVPKLGTNPDCHRMVSFAEWWDRNLIFKSGVRRLKRKNLVAKLRNQDGGAHLDPVALDPNYNAVTHGEIVNFRGRDGEYHPVPNLELAMMRQVAWELLESLERQGLAPK